MIKKTNIPHLLIVLLLAPALSSAQSNQQQLANVFLNDGPTRSVEAGHSFDKVFSDSGSSWQLDWDETYVFDNLIEYNDPTDASQSYEMRMGKGGQIYSFKSDGFGEALPPQWRPSFSELGNSLADQPPSDPVLPHHGNWAPWNDEVWMMVGSDQNDGLDGIARSKPQNIHQAGSYMNNYTHRASDHTDTPSYSPMVHTYYDEADQAFTSITWGQSEDPSYVYNPTECDPCVADSFKPSTLFYQRYKNLGDGVIQVDFLIYNYHRTRGIDYWNAPWAGIRNSSLPYAFRSNSNTDATSYLSLNDNVTTFLPDWAEGQTERITNTSGWFAFSNTLDGNGPSLAFVTAKETTNPVNAYGDLRWGKVLGPNNIRDLIVFSRRSIGGPSSPETGLKTWGIVNGESIRGRYFIVVDASIDNIVAQIQSRELVAKSSVEKVILSAAASPDVHYALTYFKSGSFMVNDASSVNSDLSLEAHPFEGSYPAYFVESDNGRTRITADPYYFSTRPYDGATTSIRLLGFSATALNIDSAVSVPLIPVIAVPALAFLLAATAFFSIRLKKTNA